MSQLIAGDNNRPATAARIITQESVFVKRKTAFGTVMERTNRFIEIRTVPMPTYSRLMTPREKAIRKLLKPKDGTPRCKINLEQRAKLRTELAQIVNTGAASTWELPGQKTA